MFDADASTYIEAVEAADTQTLETPVRYAINNFVLGCKNDGIWNAIKASCILAGARTLEGALVPLVGTAPTNVGGLFVPGDYNRKTGLIGDGSTKYLDSNRNNNADPQNSFHMGVYRSTISAPENPWFIAASDITGASALASLSTANRISIRSRSNGATVLTFSAGVREAAGLIASSRTSSTNVNYRWTSASGSISQTSQAPASASIGVFANQSGESFTASRLAFYSIGESLDLALLDARVTDLINAFGAAIP
jgi:hypothetical protein